VKDIVAAILHVTLTDGITGVFNAGYGGSVTLNEIAAFIVDQAGQGTDIQHGPVRAGDVKHSRAAVDKLLATGFKPVSSLQQGLAEMISSARG
jgi:UDP-glucose 4-epimerase